VKKIYRLPNPANTQNPPLPRPKVPNNPTAVPASLSWKRGPASGKKLKDLHSIRTVFRQAEPSEVLFSASIRNLANR
jgi:hypothetical protein